MKFNFKKYRYIGCAPLSHCPEHPRDQSTCIVTKCPGCKKDMWLSKKKRALKKDNPERVRIYCFNCIVSAAVDQALDMELFDINKII